MVSSAAQSVAAYLAELPPERQADVTALVTLIRKHLPKGFVETMGWGMIVYQVPLAVSGPTYNKQPLVVVAVAAQKHKVSLYLSAIYASDELAQEFRQRWLSSGHRLDMGKSCVRFKSLQQADEPTIAWAVGLVTPQEFVQLSQASREGARQGNKSLTR